MRTWTGIPLTALLALTVGCDPGMTIRQNSAPEVTNRVAVYVKAGHPLVGETWYAPQVKVANFSDAPITVTSVELATQRATYVNKLPRAGAYPVTVPVRETQVLEIRFDLNDSVRKTFQQAGDIRVHYVSKGKKAIAVASVIGGPLSNDVSR